MGIRILTITLMLLILTWAMGVQGRAGSLPDSTAERFAVLLGTHAETPERIRKDMRRLVTTGRGDARALEAQRRIEQLVDTHRRYRIALLDLRQAAFAADDDDLANAIGNEITKANTVILETEAQLTHGRQVDADPAGRLPGGLERNLVLHYRFDQSHGRQVMDASGRGHHGTVHGARWSGLGRRGGAFWLDGVDDYIETPDTPLLQAKRALTLSVCVYPEPDEGVAAGFAGHVLSKSAVSGSDYQLDIAAGHAVSAALRHREAGGRQIRVAAEPAKCTVGIQQWVHIVFVYDGRVAQTFINGERDKTVTAPEGIGTSAAPFNIGRSGNGVWEFGFTGRVDDVLVWDRALSEAEVLGLWTSLKRAAKDPSWLGG